MPVPHGWAEPLTILMSWSMRLHHLRLVSSVVDVKGGRREQLLSWARRRRSGPPATTLRSPSAECAIYRRFRNVRARTRLAHGTSWSAGHPSCQGRGCNMLRRYAARLLSSSVEFKRQTEGVVDGPEFIETHAANTFAEPSRSYRRGLFDEYLCFSPLSVMVGRNERLGADRDVGATSKVDSMRSSD